VDNVRILPDGEAVSVDGTHLGHNLPDYKGNRHLVFENPPFSNRGMVNNSTQDSTGADGPRIPIISWVKSPL